MHMITRKYQLLMNKSKNDFQDKLVAGSPWSDALTDDTIDFNDNGTLVCYAIDNYGGVYGGMEYKIATCEYKVKPGNKIVIGGKTVDVSFRVDGKIIFEPDIYPLIKQEAKVILRAYILVNSAKFLNFKINLSILYSLFLLVYRIVLKF